MTPSIFLRIIDGKLVLWNYVNHEQYEIQIEHLSRILAISGGENMEQSEIDIELEKTEYFQTPSRTDGVGTACPESFMSELK